MRVYETFSSYQGEGSKVGLPCTFVRTAGCNLDCSFCDTDWKVKGEKFNIQTYFSTEWVWLTGGEPLMQDVTSYVNEWRRRGHKVGLETNGTFALPCEFDHVTVSPKAHDDRIAVRECTDLKVVVPSYNPLDYDCIIAEHRFIQPEWGSPIPQIDDMPQGWRLSMQNHKFWDVR